MKVLILVAAAACLTACTTMDVAPTPPMPIGQVASAQAQPLTVKPLACADTLASNYSAQRNVICGDANYTAMRVFDDLSLGEGECTKPTDIGANSVHFYCQYDGEKQQIVASKDAMLATYE